MLKQIVHKVTNHLGYQITRITSPLQPIELPYLDLLDLVVQDYRQYQPELFIMQIGAHDGFSADPINQIIRKYGCKGLLVEPQPHIFQKLVEHYQDQPQLLFENAAISQRVGTTPFYVVKPEFANLTFWLSQSASLDREIVRGALHYWRNLQGLTAIPEDLDLAIDEISLPALTIQSLLSKHQIQKIDLLVIDTMGFYYEILKMFPFEQVKPAIINSEYGFIPEADQQDCLRLLADQGYNLAKMASDVIAYQYGGQRRWTLPSW